MAQGTPRRLISYAPPVAKITGNFHRKDNLMAKQKRIETMFTNMPKADEAIEPESETVDLLATGYEWECPSSTCGHLNRIIESAKQVTCSVCGETFDAMPPTHV